MKNNYTNPLSCIHIFACLVALIPGTSSALDVTVVPRAQAGVMNYEFEKVAVDATFTPEENVTVRYLQPSKKILSSMPLISGGVTAFIDAFFIDLYLQKASSGSDSWSESVDGDGARSKNVSYSDFDRKERSISLGYGIGSRWAVFGGYRKSTTSFSDLKVFTIDQNASGEPISPQTYRSVGDRKLEQDGYFVGGTYAFPVGNNSAITLNLAVAFLDGEHSSAFRLETDTPDNVQKRHFKGDTVGLNLGVAWKGRLYGQLSYSLGVNGYNYEFDGTETENYSPEDKPDEIIPLEHDQTLSESVLRFSAGLSYEF